MKKSKTYQQLKNFELKDGSDLKNLDELNLLIKQASRADLQQYTLNSIQ